MFERFTERARKVMALANQEAQRFNHQYIGTEHILLGLVKEGSGTGANTLGVLGVDIDRIRREVEMLVKPGPEIMTAGRLPQTPAAKRVIEGAIEEARRLNHAYIGTEHLLLGLIREENGVAAAVLANLGLTLDGVRGHVLEALGVTQRMEPVRVCREHLETARRSLLSARDAAVQADLQAVAQNLERQAEQILAILKHFA